jgi:hypothetical protein
VRVQGAIGGVVGGIGALGERAARAGLFARASQTWHGAVFADAAAIASCLPRFEPGSSILALTADGGALLGELTRRDPTLCPLDPALAWDPQDPGAPRPDVVLLADVLHHTEPRDREELLRDLRARAADDAVFVVKEFAPGGLRSGVGWVADRALSGDRVDFLPPFELRALAARAWPGLAAFWTPLFELDPPNYCFVFQQLRIA